MDQLLRDTFTRHEELVPTAGSGLRAAILSGARRRRARRRWSWVGALAAAVLLAAPLTALPRPAANPEGAAPSGPLDLLLVGVDRASDVTAARVRANAIVLVHVEPAKQTAYEVTIPRDLLLDLPGLGPQRADGAFLVGGYGRISDAVAALTGVHVDGGAVVDLAGLESVTRAAGGVDLCVTRRVVSRQADEPTELRLTYEPGCRHFDPHEAADYLRAAVGSGDDKALHQYLLALAGAAEDRSRLPGMLAAAGDALELHLGAASLGGLASTLRRVDPRRLATIRLPSTTGTTATRTPLPDGDGLYAALRTGDVGPWLAAHPQYGVD